MSPKNLNLTPAIEIAKREIVRRIVRDGYATRAEVNRALYERGAALSESGENEKGQHVAENLAYRLRRQGVLALGAEGTGVWVPADPERFDAFAERVGFRG